MADPMNDFTSDPVPSADSGDPAFDKRVRRHVTGRIRDYFAVTTPGLEDLCRNELIGLGMDSRESADETGGAAFKGRLVDCQLANLCLRTATRVLMRIDAFTATNPRQLKRRCAAIPWELFLPAGILPDIKASSRRSRLYHGELIADGVREGLMARLGPLSDSHASVSLQTLFVRLAEDRATLSLDSSGEALYKRGLKAGPARAPIRETLAAAILMAAGYDGRQPLVDPLCGSGTFSLEAAMMAKGLAAGGRRTFAFMGWPAFRPAQWRYLEQAARDGERRLARPSIFASDIDAGACRELASHVAANGLSDAVSVSPKDFFDCEADHYPGGPGLVTINPPYGIRLGAAGAAADLFRRICRHLNAAFKGWTVALIAPESGFLDAVPFPVRQRPLMHGGLKVTLCCGKVVR